MEKVKCDHCGNEIDRADAVPCTWKEIDETWYYCKPCGTGVFAMGIGKLKIRNKKAMDNIMSMDKHKSCSIQGKSTNIAVLDELNKYVADVIITTTNATYVNADLLKYLNTCDGHKHDWTPVKNSTDVRCIRCGVKAMQNDTPMGGKDNGR